ncbi:hypothetical protein BDN67DRAFT_992728 [Paxillus ammoniavirescens]|nr:hypothetical protein BDN67DRAFT_992728 [Paxillus ammoniavirescens]
MEYHPKSGHTTITESFSAFSRSYSAPQPIDNEPINFQVSLGHFKGLGSCSHTMTPFEKHTVPVQHKKQDLEYKVYIQPLWDWAMDLLQDPLLSPFFTWDTQHLYKHNGTRFEQFIDEPWTADRWWKIQLALPENGVPFAFILYADKSHLSSSGKVKSYPVIARCGNLPIGIQNGNGIGGGRLVGWLSIGAEDTDKSGKLSFTNLKNVIWHESFLKLLDSIILLSKTGFSHSCFDEINTFWRVNHSDTAYTLCFDVLHFGDLGLWGKHLFRELKRLLNELGHHAEKTVNEQHNAFPRWHNFNHFKTVMNVSFSDGNKFSDISKQILFTTQNVLTQEDSPLGYALLQCIADYMEYHMYITLDVHTESNLTAGEEGLLTFQHSLEGQKNWNFPKAHLSKHTFRDILETGAAQNFSTRPNESVHGPIRHLYLFQTNQKNTAEQILRLDHITLVSEFICLRMDHLDQERLKKDDETETLDDRPFSGHIYLGLPLSPVTFAHIEKTTTLPVFQDFRKKFMQKEFQYLKVNYESHIDWKLVTDYLQCNPCFHGWECYNYVLIRSHDRHQNEKLIFAHLLFMFCYTVSEHTLDLTLVLSMDVPSGPRCTVDKDLHFKHLHARASMSSEFIPLQSVVHGALLVPDFKHDGDFFLINYIDGDMFLRSKTLHIS